MHRLLISVAALIAITNAAYAADASIPLKAASPAVNNSAGIGPYVSWHAGAQWLNKSTVHMPFDNDTGFNTYDVGYTFGTAIGYNFNKNFGVEGEVSYSLANAKHTTLYDNTDLANPLWSNPAHGRVGALTIMGNAIVGAEWSALHPYIGAGAGVAIVHNNTTTFNESFDPLHFVDTDVAWAAQAFVGADVRVTNDTSVGARYRVRYIGPFTLADGAINPERSVWQSAELTLKHSFGHSAASARTAGVSNNSSNWSGPYVGVNVGYGWGSNDLLTVSGPITINPDGALVGGQLGYDWNIGQQFVVGLAGDVSWAGMSDSKNCALAGICFPPDSSVKFDLNWLSTVRARAGVTAGNFLVYGTAGAAVAGTRVKLNGVLSFHNGPGINFSANQINLGWVVGAGAEFKVTNSISVGAEYLYIDFGKNDHPFYYFGDLDEYAQSSLKANIIRTSVNYRF
jgi:outer membrane immunogenic protein